MRPVIGITCDTVAGLDLGERQSPDSRLRYQSPYEYARVVAEVGGLAVLLPFEEGCVDDYLELCDGFIFTGGDDPDTVMFGEAVHPQAKLIDPRRQAFEMKLLESLKGTGHGVLGVCLGMQMMALHAGGRLIQHMADEGEMGEEVAGRHYQVEHEVEFEPGSVLFGEAGVEKGCVYSHHHQAVGDAGGMRVVGRCGDGVMEAIESGGVGRFYVGVQWHPERTEGEAMGRGVIRRLVEACGRG